MHRPKVSKVELQERIYIYIYKERERERERESIYLFVWAKYRQNGRERQIFIVKKGGEKSQNKRKIKGWRNCKVKVQSSGEIKR